MASQDVLAECSPGFSELRTTVAVLERDVAQQTRVSDKLSEAVEKIQEMNANLCRMISLHELKHDGAEKVHKDIELDLKEITSRIDNLMETKSIIKSPQQIELEKAISELIKWKYIFTGAAIVIGYLIGHINWTLFFSFFKG